MTGLFVLRDDLGNRNQDIDGQQTDTILVVICQVLEETNHLVNHNGAGHLLDELGEVIGGLSAYHWGIIMNEVAELLAQTLLHS